MAFSFCRSINQSIGFGNVLIRRWYSLLNLIYHFRTEVAPYNLEIEWSQEHPDEFPEINSAFVRFNNDLSAPFITLAIKAQTPPSWTLKQGTTAADTI